MKYSTKLSELRPSHRLLGEADRVGRLLLDASETEFRTPPGEFARLVALRDERTRRVRVIQGVMLLAPAVALVVAFVGRGHENSGSSISAEVARSEVPSLIRSREGLSRSHGSAEGSDPSVALPSTAEVPRELGSSRKVTATPRMPASAPSSRGRYARANDALEGAPAKEGALPIVNDGRDRVAAVAEIPPRAPEASTVVESGDRGVPDGATDTLSASAGAVRSDQLETNLPSGGLVGERYPPSTGRSTQDCQALMRAERYSEASQCQGVRAAQSTGTAAELALLNKARIETKALGRPELALKTLRSYRARFPQGVLVREAEIAENQAQKALNARSTRR